MNAQESETLEGQVPGGGEVSEPVRRVQIRFGQQRPERQDAHRDIHDVFRHQDLFGWRVRAPNVLVLVAFRHIAQIFGAVFELGEMVQEYQIHLSDRAVALLGD